MATNHTSNYQLNQWEPTDQVLRSDFNADNAKVDAALAGLATTDQEHETKMTQLNQQLSLRGNCQAYFTTYMGTGENQASLTFPHKPTFFCIMDPSEYFSVIALYGVTSVLSHATTNTRSIHIQWSGNTVTWSSNDLFDYQCNQKDRAYPVLALLDLTQ